MSEQRKGESSAEIRERVVKARLIQQERYKDEEHIHCNAQMNSRLLQKYAQLDKECNDTVPRHRNIFDCIEPLRFPFL
ncbi:MAG: hypothetical protein MJZ23_03155 [Paludibacteraceae bacterium]|nr:hypothetical protein [Paludibacteraceae bacterium]